MLLLNNNNNLNEFKNLFKLCHNLFKYYLLLITAKLIGGGGELH